MPSVEFWDCSSRDRHRFIVWLAGSLRSGLCKSVVSGFAAIALGVGLNLAFDFTRFFPEALAPQKLFDSIVLTLFRGDSEECSRNRRRRCAVVHETDPDPLYAPFEEALRKVLRNAGI